jgi:hypothetical protein
VFEVVYRSIVMLRMLACMMSLSANRYQIGTTHFACIRKLLFQFPCDSSPPLSTEYLTSVVLWILHMCEKTWIDFEPGYAFQDSDQWGVSVNTMIRGRIPWKRDFFDSVIATYCCRRQCKVELVFKMYFEWSATGRTILQSDFPI